MSLLNEFDSLRQTVNSMLGDFGSGLGGGQRRGGRKRGGWGGSAWGMDPFGFDDSDMFDMPLLLGGDIQGGQRQRGQPSIGGKVPEETKMEDVQPTGGQVQGGGAETQLAQRQEGTMTPTFRPDQFMRARVNIEDCADKYIVTAEVPGFDKSNIKVNVTDDGLLHIQGVQSKEWTDQSKDKKYLRAERTFANVQRSLRLPRGVDPGKISANYENGILHVNLPKTEEQQKKTSEIQIQ